MIKHLIRFALTLFGVSIISFLLLDFVPGDAAELLLSRQPEAFSGDRITALRQELGLDAPLPMRYCKWLARAVVLDFGTSFRSGEPVSQEILHRLPTTLTLAGAAFVFTVFLSLIGGIVSAVFHNRLPDRCHRIWTICTVSIPDYWLGLMLMLVFSLKLNWFPVIGGNGFTQFIMPVMTLGLSISAAEGRIFRANILEVLGQDYVLFASAKGLSQTEVFLHHVFRPALLPMISLWGMLLGHLLGGAVIVESVFSLPGLGKLAVDAVSSRDIPMIQGTVLTMTLFFLLASRAMDLLYMLLLPRRRNSVCIEGIT
ncbi:MAG: ABC transporter permease [Candidatus Electrothrix sp. AS4_5]|nr:ABC transporter permease [Candidatus Electrothrix gigas]